MRIRFYNRKAVISSIFVVLIMCFTSTAIPAIYNSANMDIFEEHKEIQAMKIFEEESRMEIVAEINNLLKILSKNRYDQEYTESLTNEDFETYWQYYGRAKGYWAAYLPPLNPNQFMPSRDRGIYLWSANNYYDWFEKAMLNIWGDEDTRQLSEMHVVNLIILAFDVFAGGLGLLFLLLGLPGVVGAYFLAAALLFFFAILFTGVILWYNVVVMFYFLIGVNAYYQLLDRGNANIVIDVVDIDDNPIENCQITTYSIDAFAKSEDNPDWPGWNPSMERWVWSKSEFEYYLLPSNNEFSGRYSLFEYSQNPLFNKAVPPPGSYNITINPPYGWEGPDEDGKTISVGPISSNTAWNEKITLNVTKK